ncbi:signal transduction histidine kinase [Rippkaea orientalis PCC 8801]|uniref:histidine kinase n=1 Tax=Rippkaea orientalis (strain PCC 8801 / RF-1) TaxID=41431 RepID=B7JUE6_RIPO1|nr:PAS domain S-box protein [Rippkaea orientalis]ACK64526.1 signal transduction histidine kinase [Rippkaea orientalis PCC 8801]
MVYFLVYFLFYGDVILGNGQNSLITLHLTSDILITIAYYCVASTLIYLSRKCPDFSYQSIGLLLSIFLIICGTIHLIEIATLWHPNNGLFAIIKSLAALLSIYIAINLIFLISKTKYLDIKTVIETSQARLEGILNIAEDAIICINHNQQITLFNQGAEKIFGWKALDILGKPLYYLLPKRFVSEHQQYVKEFSESDHIPRKMSPHREIFGLRRDGTEFPAEASISQLKLPNETIFTVILRDISQRKQADKLFKEHEERFRKVFEEGPLGMAIVGLDYRFINVNHTLCQMLGYSESELLALTFVEVTHPDDIDKDIQLAEQLYNQEIPYYSLEKRYITKNGQILWVMLTAACLRDEQGKLRYGFAMVENINSRKQSEARLKQYEHIVSATSDAVILLDRDYTYQLANQAYLNLHQKTSEEVIGHRVSEILGEKVFQTQVKPFVDRTFLGEPLKSQDWFELPLLGRQFISANFFPYVEADHNISGVVISLRNVTDLKQIEESLRENKLKFRQLIDNVRDVLYIHDTQTYQLLYLSPAFEKIWGIPCAKVYENPYAWIDSIHPDDRESVTIAFDKQMMSGTKFDEEYRIIRPNGEIRWIWSRSFPVLDESGNIYRMAGIAEDITERKAIQKTLELQDVIVKNMAEGVCLVSASNGELVYSNPKFERMFGYEIGELKGKHVSIVNYEDESQSAEDVNQEIRHHVLAKGEYTYEVYNVKKDGTPFWCRATTSCFDHPDYGKVLVAVQEDIDDRKQTEEALIASEQRLQYLISSSPVVIFSCKSDGNFEATYVSENVINVLGYSSQVFLDDSRFWIDHIHPDDLEGVLLNLPTIFTRELHSHEFRFLRSDGTYCWLFEQIRLMRDSKGKPKEILGYLVDISDRKEAEQKIAASLQEKEVLLREIHHRVKNNLQVICSLLNLQSRSVQDGSIKELLQESRNRVRSMSLVHEKLYRSENIASINLADYINDLVNNLLNSYKTISTKITLKANIDPRISLNIDAAVPCGLIVNELISNAYKYAFSIGDQGEILLKAMINNNQELVLTVTDNGKGLPKDFDLDQVKTLGLQLVKSLTNQLRGKITINSKGGTQFEIILTRIH